MIRKSKEILFGSPLTLVLLACSSEVTPLSELGSPPDVYEFDSQYEKRESSVSYTGQTMRHVLISDLNTFIGGLTQQIDDGELSPSTGDVAGALNFYFEFDGASSGEEALLLETEPEPKQNEYADIAEGKNLVDKIAGNDSSTDHRTWSSEFKGWDGALDGVTASTPEGLVRAFFDAVDGNAVARFNGDSRLDPDGNELPVHLTVSGLDLQQLIQKFLLTAITFSQGTDDYLDDATGGKGLLSSHERPDDGAFTELQHAWDEGFGYFGAGRNYGNLSLDELVETGYADSDTDGEVDLTSEYSFGASINAAKRDKGSADSAKTSFARDAFEAFVAGRHLLNSTEGKLDDAEMEALREYRDTAVSTWEKALAATVVHYINDVLQDMAQFGEEGYSFSDHVKHWSELKGFALAFQFNPRSPLPQDTFEDLHEHIGSAPVLPSASEDTIEDYAEALLKARKLLGKHYDFAEENLGDNDGTSGW